MILIRYLEIMYGHCLELCCWIFEILNGFKIWGGGGGVDLHFDITPGKVA